MAKLILLVGLPFSGKTTSAATWPKPMKYIDLDNHFDSAKYAKNKKGEVIVPDWKEIEVITLLKPTPQKLSLSASMEKGQPPPSHTAEAPGVVKAYNDAIDTITPDKHIKTVVIDSLSTMARIWKEGILQFNKIPSLRISDYLAIEGILLGQFLPTLRILPVDYSVVITHVETDKDELLGKIEQFPVGPSANQGRKLAKEFDEVYLQVYENGEYFWVTKPRGLFVGAGSRMGLPERISPPTFQELSRYIKEEVN